MNKRELKKGESLWKQGEAAGTVAVVESGAFGVVVEKRLTGLMSKGMVIGEGAILGSKVSPRHRTASVFALTGTAAVSEVGVADLEQAVANGDRFLVGPILVTLVGQICRNCLLLIESQHEDPMISGPVNALMAETVKAFRAQPAVESWDQFAHEIGILVASRDYTDDLRAKLDVDGSDRAAIKRASEAVREQFKDHESLAALVALIDSERHKNDVAASAGDDDELAVLIRG